MPKQEADREAYAKIAKEALADLLGEKEAEAVLFYTGEPNPPVFEAILLGIFGPGAEIIMREIDRRVSVLTDSSPSKTPHLSSILSDR